MKVGRSLDAATERTVMYALRHPRGRYQIERTSQLSGIPRSTLYDWRREKVYVPDFDSANPLAWSYRDLAFLRLLAWLRQLNMPRAKAAGHVREIKKLLANGEDIRHLHADGTTLLIDQERISRLSGQSLLPFDNLLGLLSTFDLLDPVEELRRRGQQRVWAPDLVAPSDHTSISPWVLAGEPCVHQTRIPTSAVHALHEERGLSTAEIVRLYPGLRSVAADDAYLLERRLRGIDLPEPLAA